MREAPFQGPLTRPERYVVELFVKQLVKNAHLKKTLCIASPSNSGCEYFDRVSLGNDGEIFLTVVAYQYLQHELPTPCGQSCSF